MALIQTRTGYVWETDPDEQLNLCQQKFVALITGITPFDEYQCCENSSLGSYLAKDELTSAVLNEASLFFGFKNGGPYRQLVGQEFDFCHPIQKKLWEEFLLVSFSNKVFAWLNAIINKLAVRTDDCSCTKPCEPCECETTSCCPNDAVFIGLGLAATIVFERIEMGKKVRGEDHKHGLALGLVLTIVFMIIISNSTTDSSAFWLLLLGIVVFIGMSLIQGKSMRQYKLNRESRFSDFTSEINENSDDIAAIVTPTNGFYL